MFNCLRILSFQLSLSSVSFPPPEQNLYPMAPCQLPSTCHAHSHCPRCHFLRCQSPCRNFRPIHGRRSFFRSDGWDYGEGGIQGVSSIGDICVLRSKYSGVYYAWDICIFGRGSCVEVGWVLNSCNNVVLITLLPSQWSHAHHSHCGGYHVRADGSFDLYIAYDGMYTSFFFVIV